MNLFFASIAIGVVAGVPIFFLVGLPIRLMTLARPYRHEVCLSPYYVAPFTVLALVTALGAYLFLYEPWYAALGLILTVIYGQVLFEVTVRPMVIAALSKGPEPWGQTTRATL